MTRARTASVAGSLLAHALLVAFAWTRVEAPAKPTRETVTITLVSPPPAPPPVAPPPPPPKPLDPPKRTPPRREVRNVQKPLNTPAPPPPPVASSTPSRAPPETPTVAPVAPATPPETPEIKPKQVDLFSPQALSKSVERGLSIAPPKEGEPPPKFGRLPGESAGEFAKTEEERIAQRVAGTSLDANARSRVRAGLVDPTYSRIGRALLDSWDPERALPDDGAAAWAKDRAQNAVIGTQLMMETARRYAATGSPMVDGETLDEGVRSDRHDATTQATYEDLQRTRETFRQYMKGKFNEGRSAQVLVEETPDGKIRVSIIKASGDNDVDRGAMEDIQHAIERLHDDQGVPPSPRRTVWSFRLKIIINPPLPVGGFEWDEVIDSPKLELPLGRKLLKHVQLEAVYDDDPRMTERSP